MLKYRVMNRGMPRTVYLLHGLGTTAGFWLGVPEVLSRFRLFFIDLDFGVLREGRDGFGRLAAALEELVAHSCGPGGGIVVGHSFGGTLAAALRTDHPKFLLCPTFLARRDGYVRFRAFSRNPGFVARGVGEGFSVDDLIDRAIEINEAVLRAPRPPDRRVGLLPAADQFFSFLPAERHFDDLLHYPGDHFEIAGPARMIDEQLP